ncbi:ATP-binding cassette domain-containing protein [Marinobacteraceae bacterium S3BR75-40.1]
MLTIQDLSLQRGGVWLLDQASVTVQPGQRVAIVGPNGAGKSSLFQLILGQLSAERGEVHLPGGCRIAHMAQEVEASERSAVDYVLDGHGELRRLEQALAEAEQAGDDQAQARLHGELDAIRAWEAPRQAASLLRGLGFADQELDQPVRRFSGGWRIRLNLARALMQPSDLLLLDEPTNHLDLEACYWLENWLRQYSGTLLFISHDRDFIDRLATHVLHFDRQSLTLYPGGYSDFEIRRSERLAQQQAQYERQQARVAEVQRFIDRFRAKATKAKQAQSRIKALERMETIAPAHVDSPFQFEFPTPQQMSNPLLNIRQAAVGYGGKPLLQGVNLVLMPGTRVGVLGANGSGKSTLMGVLNGALPLLAGERVEGEHLRIGHFAQHQLEALDMEASPFLHIQRLSPRTADQSIRNFLGGFDFRGDAAFEKVGQFSGGEKARLALALIAWQKPNLLLLDEPTNHLDLEMREALTLALQGFEGALVIISHDRHLLRNSVDDFWLVSEGHVTEFDGDLDAYERWLAEKDKAPTAKPEQAENGGGKSQDRKAQKRAEAEKRQRLSPLRKKMKQLEADIDRQQQALQVLEEQLADPALYGEDQKERLKELLQEQAVARAAQEEAEMEWLALGEEIESLELQD